MKYFFTLIFFLLFFNFSFSQKRNSVELDYPKNLIYLEIGGKSFMIGINLTYERLIYSKNNYSFNGLIAFGYEPSYIGRRTYSIGFNYLFRKNKKINFDIGFESTLLQSTDMGRMDNRKISSGGLENEVIETMAPCLPDYGLYLGLNFGIRFKTKHNFIYKINYTPSIYRGFGWCETPLYSPLWLGLSFGKLF